MPPADLNEFHTQARARDLGVFRWAAIIFNFAYVAWLAFDFILAPSVWRDFVPLRLAAAGLNTAIIIAVHRPALRRFVWEAFWLWSLVFFGFTAAMLPAVGAALLPYAMGYSIIMFGVTMMTWPPRWAVSILALSVALAAVVLLGAGMAGTRLVPPVFVMVTVAAIVAVVSWSRYSAARREYLARAELSLALKRENDAKQRLEYAHTELRQRAESAHVGRLSGTRLGDYFIQELVGRGGMAEVYQALRVDDGQLVAVKVLHAHLGREPELRARFRREAEAVKLMPARHVAELYGFGVTDDGFDYIVMELLRGEDLATSLRRRSRLTPAELAPIVRAIAEGIAAAHALGIVHRDLKPPNVFLCARADGVLDLRVLDFGVAHLLESESLVAMTQTSAMLGSPGYMAPEQARGQHRSIGPHTDVFGLGAIMYRALTGEPAFRSRNPAVAAVEAMSVDPAPPSTKVPGLPTDVDHVVALCLAKTIEQRYAAPLEAARDFELATEGRLDPVVRERARRLPVATEQATLTSTSLASSET